MSILYTDSYGRDAKSAQPITIEPYLAEAQTLVNQLPQPKQRLQKTFIALAQGDTITGLLAFYLWRRAARR